MVLPRYDIGHHIVLEAETDVRTIRFYDGETRIASLNVVATGIDSCRIKNLAVTTGYDLKPSIIKGLMEWLKQECGYTKIAWERAGEDGFIVKSHNI